MSTVDASTAPVECDVSTAVGATAAVVESPGCEPTGCAVSTARPRGIYRVLDEPSHSRDGRLVDITYIIWVMGVHVSQYGPSGSEMHRIVVSRKYWADNVIITSKAPDMVELQFQKNNARGVMQMHCIMPDGTHVTVDDPDHQMLLSIAAEHDEFLQLFADTPTEPVWSRIAKLQERVISARKYLLNNVMRTLLYKFDLYVELYKTQGLIQLMPADVYASTAPSIIAEIAAIYVAIMRFCEADYKGTVMGVAAWIEEGDA